MTHMQLSRPVIRWRRHQLRRAGYDELAAFRLAADGTVDIHEKLLVKDRTAPRQETPDAQ